MLNNEKNTIAAYSQAVQESTECKSLINSIKANTQNNNNNDFIEIIKQLTQQITNMTNIINNLKLSLFFTKHYYMQRKWPVKPF